MVDSPAEPYLVLVCGSRQWADEDLIEEHMVRLPPNTTIIHGNARGADQLAGRVAKRLGFPVRVFPAQWGTPPDTNMNAGKERNLRMLDERPDEVLAFSISAEITRGTAHTLHHAEKRGIQTRVVVRPQAATIHPLRSP